MHRKEHTFIYKVWLHLFVALLSIGSTIDAQAQDTPEGRRGIVFDEREFDFGELKESMKFATHRFRFRNLTDKVVLVNKVESSCGCTSPTWSQNSIQPGEFGYVDARYETTNRLGKFDKTLTVYTNSTVSPITFLAIKGVVVKPKPIPNNFKIPNTGRLDYERLNISFEPLFDNKSTTKVIRVVNSSEYTSYLTVMVPHRIPNYAKIEVPKALEPGEVGKVMVTLDGTLAPGYGYGDFELAIQSNNRGTPMTSIRVSYVRKQFFPELSKRQLRRAPKLQFKSESIDFGKQKSGGFLNGSFEFTNKGKKPLVIHQINPDCPCIRMENQKLTLEPGETKKLDFRFDTVTKTGKKSIGIRFVSNDPRNPERYVWVKSEFPTKYDYECPTCPKD